jgi:hypothetical protein
MRAKGSRTWGGGRNKEEGREENTEKGRQNRRVERINRDCIGDGGEGIARGEGVVREKKGDGQKDLKWGIEGGGGGGRQSFHPAKHWALTSLSKESPLHAASL